MKDYYSTRGRRVYDLGQDIPRNDLALFIEARSPNLVAISADIVEDECKFVYDVNNKIVPASKRSGAISIVGGARIPSDFSGRLRCDLLSNNISDIMPLHERLSKRKVAAAK